MKLRQRQKKENSTATWSVSRQEDNDVFYNKKKYKVQPSVMSFIRIRLKSTITLILHV